MLPRSIENVMTSIRQGFNASIAANTLKLLEAQSRNSNVYGIREAGSSVNTSASKKLPTVGGATDFSATFAARIAAIIETTMQSFVGDTNAATTNQASKRAWVEAAYSSVDKDVSANFEDYVREALADSDGTKDNISLQEALKNGAVTIESGEKYGLKSGRNEFYFDGNGNYTGMAAANWDGNYDQKLIEHHSDGSTTLQSNGKKAVLGAISGKTFVVSW
jgi:hypothetical protein